MSKSRLALVFAVLMLGIGIVYAATSFTHTGTGKYQPFMLTINPLTKNIGNVTTNDVIKYNITVINTSNFPVNITYAVSGPNWITVQINAWNTGQFKVVNSSKSMNIQVQINVGIPPNEIVQDISYTIQFYGFKAK